jgi:hypothetical protein
MSGVSSPLAAIPSHVPAELVFDFDLHADPRLSEDTHKGYMSLHSDAPDIFFTPRNGGHWVVTRYDDLVHIMRNEPIFSTVMTVVPAPPAGTKMPVPPCCSTSSCSRRPSTGSNPISARCASTSSRGWWAMAAASLSINSA